MALMKITLSAMHAEHRRWLQSLADSREPETGEPAPPRKNAA
jgi:hypothetical protein